MTAGLRRLLLAGGEPALGRALDLLHVHGDVRGVEEREGECEVWLMGAPPAQLGALAGVTVRELPITADLFAHTGLERDAPVLVAPDLCVRPPWVARPAGFAGVELVVPRGSAFGSGEHASTRAALLALHRAWPARPVAAAVDIGTGSGILALYAAQRGTARVFACDLDPSAVRAAADLVPGLRAVCGAPRTLAVAADVVVANMTARELGDELREIARLWRRAGLLVLGGLRGRAEVEACRAGCVALGLPARPSEHAVEAFTALAWQD